MRPVSIVILAAALALGAAASEACAQNGDRSGVVAEFSGERLSYEVSFLFFSAAFGRISLEPEGDDPAPDGRGGRGSGRYVATLSAETKGFVGFLDRRKHVYTAILEPCEGGARWCSRVFVKDLTERRAREVTTTFVNPARGLLTWITRRDGVAGEIGAEPMEPGARYDDMLAALFNFRAGVYGPIEKGRRYRLQTFPVEGVRFFDLRILDGDEEREARRKYGMGDSGVVIAVKLPKAIFKNEGEVAVWFSPDMVPLSATVENYIGFGDVTGWLVEAIRPSSAPPVPRSDLEAARRERSEPTPGQGGSERGR